MVKSCTFEPDMKNSKKPFVIGISGGSGSGKTTLVNILRDFFADTDLCIVSQDDYYFPREKQEKDKKGVENFDLPSSIDSDAFKEDIKALLRGEAVERLEYTFNNKAKTPKKLIFKPAPVIIVEGLFVFHLEKIRKMLDFLVFVQAKENLKVIRRINRDQIERNYPLDDVLYRYENHVLPTYEKYIAPYIDRSDIVINNNSKGMKMGIETMKAVIKSHVDTYHLED